MIYIIFAQSAIIAFLIYKNYKRRSIASELLTELDILEKQELVNQRERINKIKQEFKRLVGDARAIQFALSKPIQTKETDLITSVFSSP